MAQIVEGNHFFMEGEEGGLYSGMAHRNFIYMIALLGDIFPLLPPPAHQIQVPETALEEGNLIQF